MRGVTVKLSGFILGTAYESIPAEVVERAKMCLLDWIGGAYAGKGSPTDRIMEKLIREKGGRKIATLLGCGFSAPPAEAALYNGMISAVMEIDDVHEEASLHTGIGVVPAALAVAEYTGSSGRDLIASLVTGYDISARLARSAGASHYQFWHTTGTCNTYGAAAAAGKLLRLDEEKMAMALGLAGTQAAGFWESLNAEATTAKHLHSGKAASNGVFSAFLAREGFKGAERIIEGAKGFLASSSEATEQEVARITEDFGRPFLITKNFFKKYACCRGCFEGIEAMQKILSENGLSHLDIDTVRVTMKPMRTWLVGNEKPRDIYEAKFSLPFCMALMAVKGSAGLEEFHTGNLNDPAVRDVMGKVRLISDPEITVKTRIEVVCRDKRVFLEEPVCRSLSLEEVREKFCRNMTPLLNRKEMERILNLVSDLDRIRGIKELTQLLKRRPRGGRNEESR